MADFLIDQGYYTGAGEMLWGALACALDALSRKRYGHDLGTNRARLDFIDDMGNMGHMLADDVFLFRSNAVALHSHFYKPWMPYDKLMRDIFVVRSFIERILAMESEGD